MNATFTICCYSQKVANLVVWKDLLMKTVFPICPLGQGFLAVMPMPGLMESIEQSFDAIQKAKVSVVVSLQEAEEAKRFGLANESELCQRFGIEFRSFPIKDHSPPNDVQAVAELSQWAYQTIINGAGLVFHCYAGIGRSATMAAAVLLQAGVSVDDAFVRISQARGFPTPDRPSQRAWLLMHEQQLVIGGPSG